MAQNSILFDRETKTDERDTYLNAVEIFLATNLKKNYANDLHNYIKYPKTLIQTRFSSIFQLHKNYILTT